jgi:hypothetical protein
MIASWNTATNHTAHVDRPLRGFLLQYNTRSKPPMNTVKLGERPLIAVQSTLISQVNTVKLTQLMEISPLSGCYRKLLLAIQSMVIHEVSGNAVNFTQTPVIGFLEGSHRN